MDLIAEILPLPDTKTTISVLSFNFESLEIEDEVKEKINVILKLEPDVVALQGIVSTNCEVLFRALKSSKYKYLRFDGPGKNKEFEVLASKNTIIKGGYTPFVKSSQQRGICKFLVVAGEANPQKVWIFTAQFDSSSVVNRKIQVSELISEAKKHEDLPVIFAGNTNIPSWQDLKAPDEWKDAWREKGKSRNEKTSLHDRFDQMWCTKVSVENFDIVKFDNAEDVRRGIFSTFSF